MLQFKTEEQLPFLDPTCRSGSICATWWTWATTSPLCRSIGARKGSSTATRRRRLPPHASCCPSLQDIDDDMYFAMPLVEAARSWLSDRSWKSLAWRWTTVSASTSGTDNSGKIFNLDRRTSTWWGWQRTWRAHLRHSWGPHPGRPRGAHRLHRAPWHRQDHAWGAGGRIREDWTCSRDRCWQQGQDHRLWPYTFTSPVTRWLWWRNQRISWGWDYSHWSGGWWGQRWDACRGAQS